MEQTDQAAVAAAVAGDETAFTELVQRHRRELQVHCYRMLGSFDDAEEVLQETFLRAWRRRETYAGRSTFRAWLYRIATNASLDELNRRPRRPSGPEVPWLQPYPDELLEAIPDPGGDPGTAVVEKETIELAFLVAIQHLAPAARAALILRDVLDWSAKDAAELLGTSVASVNSALQRARADMRAHLPAQRAEWAPGEDATAAERALVSRYIDATERADMDALAATLREDLRFSMPPEPGFYVGREDVLAFWIAGGFGSAERLGTFRCLVTRANRQPAVANYLRAPGDGMFRALALDVLRIGDGRIAEIVTFDHRSFARFGLPASL
jgi:RNA polymerase sigma-70 factor (TIGR02960 family)